MLMYRPAWQPAAQLAATSVGSALCYDPGVTFGVPKPRLPALVDGDDAPVDDSVNDEGSEERTEAAAVSGDGALVKRARKASSKSSVTKETPTVAALQAKASVGERVKHHIPQADLLLLAELVRRHSADYEAMSLDRRNAYQLTPGQLRQRIARMSRQFPDVWQKWKLI
uniref:Nucleolar protein 16 n=1 Tax=Macrostomum lignano TaxID=282301 RepID=A0A1I8FSK6_9PLAT